MTQQALGPKYIRLNLNTDRMKKTLFIIASVLCLASCSKDAGCGASLCLSLSGDDSISTKAVSEAEIDAFSVEVQGTDIVGTYAEMKGQSFPISVGKTFTVTAQNCSREEALTANGNLGSVRYYGESQFTTIDGENSVSIACAIVNARVNVLVDASFNDYFDQAYTVVTLANTAQFNDRSVPMGTDDYMWFEAGNDVWISVTARKKGAAKTMVYTLSEPVIASISAKTSRTVNIKLGDTDTGGLVFSVDGKNVNNSIVLPDYGSGSVVEDQ